MQISNLLSDDAILTELGERLARLRIERQITQAELARQAGVSKRTVERIEAGASTQLSSLLRILRVLDLLPNLERMIPEAAARPLDLLARKGKRRQRASGSGRTAAVDKPWSWDEDA
jgi:transcriptional regulator with XRE-family HTH domain